MAQQGNNGGGGGGFGARAIRAGAAFFELIGKDGISAVLDKAQKKVAQFSAFMARAGRTMSLAGGALLAPVALLFRGGVDRAAETARLARQLELPVEMMGKLQYAAEAAGVSVDEVLKNPEKFADLLKRAPTVDAASARQAVETQLQLKDATLALQAALLPVLQVVAPLVRDVAAFAKENAVLVRVVGLVALGMVAAGAAFGVASTALAAVAVAVKLVAGAVALVLSPIGLVVAALGGLGYAFVTMTDSGRTAFGILRNGFGGLLNTAQTTWKGVVAAVAKGDLQLAFDIVVAGLAVAWRQLVLTWVQSWNWFKGIFVDGWHDAIAGLKLIVTDFVGWIVKMLAKGWDAIVSVIEWAAKKLGFDDVAKKVGGAKLEPLVDKLRVEVRTGILDKAVKAEIDRKAARAADEADAKGKLDAAAARLEKLVGRAAEPLGEKAAEKEEYGKLLLAAARGTFNTFRTGAQFFGYGDTVEKATLDVLKKIEGGVDKLPEKIGEAVVAALLAR